MIVPASPANSRRLYSQFALGTLLQQPRDEERANIATAGNLRSTIDEFVQANASIEQASSE